MSAEQVERVAKEIWAARRTRVREHDGSDIGPLEAENSFLRESVRIEAVAALVAMGNPMPKCTSRWGHKFRARYSITNPALLALVTGADKVDVNGGAIELMKDHRYVLDICERCGFVVDRETEEKSTKPTI